MIVDSNSRVSPIRMRTTTSNGSKRYFFDALTKIDSKNNSSTKNCERKRLNINHLRNENEDYRLRLKRTMTTET